LGELKKKLTFIQILLFTIQARFTSEDLFFGNMLLSPGKNLEFR